MRVADEVLDELGVERRRVVTVFNKCDRVAACAQRPSQDGDGLHVSALTGQGIEALRAEIARRLPELADGFPGHTGAGKSGHAVIAESAAVPPRPAAVLESAALEV